MAEFDSYLVAATGAADEYTAESAKIDQASWLSAEGKTQKKAEVLGKYQKKVEAIQADARQDLERERGEASQQLVKLRAESAAAERGLLGNDLVAFEVLRRRLETLSEPQLVEALRGARDDWERAVISQVGRVLIDSRPSPDAENPGAIRVRSDFLSLASSPEDAKEAGLVEKIQRLESRLHPGSLARLDPIAYRKDLAIRFGLR